PVLALPETPDGVTILVIPFGPGTGEVPDLIALRGDVPGLRNEFDLRQHRVLEHDLQECALTLKALRPTRQRRSQIKAKAVHVHLRDPVAETIHEELQDARMPCVQGVPTAGVVDVPAPIVPVEA